MQRIYSGRKINFGAAGINVRGVRSKKLKINYRTTEPIKRVALSVVKGFDCDDMDGGKENMDGYVSLIHEGEKPKYHIVADINAEVEQVIEWLKECQDSDIKLSEIYIAALSFNLWKDLQTRLHRDGTECRIIKGAQKQGGTNGVNICTIHSLKGLEFRVVILIGVNERYFPFHVAESNSEADVVAQNEFLSSKRSLLYVAITRASQLVYMVGIGKPTGLLELSKD